MKSRSLLVLVVLLACCAVAAFADDGADPRIKAALDTIGLKYTVNSSNNYKVVYRMESKPTRSHLAFIVSKTSKYKQLETREIWSIAAILKAYPSQELIYRLMNSNSTAKIGAWAMEKTDGGDVWVMYTVKVPANLSAKELDNIIYYVAETCDELEEELLGSDEY